jgi:hypothetical protein
MYVYNGAYVPWLQIFFVIAGDSGREHDLLVFFEHYLFLLRGYAVMSLG